MKRSSIARYLLAFCLLLVLSGCGNKGPLVLPEEEDEKSEA